MAWLPISWTVPQYMDSNGDPYSGAVLKFYQDGTTTVTNMATSNTGATQLTSVALNANGYPANGGSVFIPHIDQAYKVSLYPTQAAANANTGAIWTIDNLTPADLTDTDTDELSKVSSNDSTAGFLNGKLVAGLNVTLTENSDGGNETLTIAALDSTSGLVLSETADHIATPTEGRGEIWLKNTLPNTLYLTDDSGNDWLLGGIGSSEITTYKTTTEQRSGTTLQNDTDFSFAIGANEEWIVDFSFSVNCSQLSTTNFKAQLVIPSGAEVRGGFMNASDNTVGTQNPDGGVIIDSNEFTAQMTDSAWGYVRGNFYVKASSTAGTIQLQWAKEAASASALNLNFGSNWTRRRVN